MTYYKTSTRDSCYDSCCNCFHSTSFVQIAKWLNFSYSNFCFISQNGIGPRVTRIVYNFNISCAIIIIIFDNRNNVSTQYFLQSTFYWFFLRFG